MNELIADHAEALQVALADWPEDDLPDLDSETMQRAAKNILQHAALLFRYTGDEDALRYFLELPRDERRALALAGCNAISVDDLCKRLSAIDEETIDDYDVVILEETLLIRDALGEGVLLAKRLAAGSSVNNGVLDFDLLRAFRHAQTQTDMLDDAFRALPHATRVAMSIFDGLKEAIKTPVPASHWWLQDGLAQLEENETAFIEEFFGEVQRPGQAQPAVSNIIQLFRAPTEQPDYLLAAADGGEVHEVEVVCNGVKALLAFCRDASKMTVRLDDPSGAAAPWAPQAVLVIERAGTGPERHTFDASGEIALSSLPADAPARVALEDTNGTVLWETNAL